jgi:hypothetical protein
MAGGIEFITLNTELCNANTQPDLRIVPGKILMPDDFSRKFESNEQRTPFQSQDSSQPKYVKMVSQRH